MKNIKFLKKEEGFTLIEMLIVLLIISILLIIIIPNISKQSETVKSTGCQAQVKMVAGQVEAYTLKHDAKPNSINDLVSDGFIKENQLTCKSGQNIVLNNGEVVAQ
ncbi:competence type IV pilus major pilin ComGC [Mammaliicoccus lentus]|nr:MULTISPECIES: competence type IV pilus major pilin ComGC [Mammaliicoccus]MBF0793255.1 prepilin-type N-terminal cleavage/methylation domain-containing protein [Mammaliicoccus lentus]OAO24766.1 competence protein ComGC [Mammaliicoccus lentus]TFV17767.1 prepilin-type N-terminal cleavage/methylation domain-containing protein [Mammaliicoccus lentus]WQK51387.1 competence type IV pilus major pilin ComGC [Mammaliicoccus lentus]